MTTLVDFYRVENINRIKDFLDENKEDLIKGDFNSLFTKYALYNGFNISWNDYIKGPDRDWLLGLLLLSSGINFYANLSEIKDVVLMSYIFPKGISDELLEITKKAFEQTVPNKTIYFTKGFADKNKNYYNGYSAIDISKLSDSAKIVIDREVDEKLISFLTYAKIPEVVIGGDFNTRGLGVDNYMLPKLGFYNLRINSLTLPDSIKIIPAGSFPAGVTSNLKKLKVCKDIAISKTEYEKLKSILEVK